MLIARNFTLATFRCGAAHCLLSLLASLPYKWIPVKLIRQSFTEFQTLRNMALALCVLFLLFLGNGSAVAPAAQAAVADGRMVYVQTCAACHANGVAGAPRFGVREEWAARLPLGRAKLALTVLKGEGGMPPKGGNASLSDAQALAALDYILDGLR